MSSAMSSAQWWSYWFTTLGRYLSLQYWQLQYLDKATTSGLPSRNSAKHIPPHARLLKLGVLLWKYLRAEKRFQETQLCWNRMCKLVPLTTSYFLGDLAHGWPSQCLGGVCYRPHCVLAIFSSLLLIQHNPNFIIPAADELLTSLGRWPVGKSGSFTELCCQADTGFFSLIAENEYSKCILIDSMN